MAEDTHPHAARAQARKENSEHAASETAPAGGTRSAPAAGTMVSFVLPSGPAAGAVRTALVTRANDDGTANLSVFLDGPTDSLYQTPCGPILVDWYPQVAEDAAGTTPGTYHT
jgi:hypothetical protein